MQELFNRAVSGVLKQGRPSYDADTDSCLYRSPDGCKCAVGFLIDDDRYQDRLEHKGLYHTVVIDALISSNPNESFYQNTIDMLTDLQRAHDLPAQNHPSATFIEVFIGEAKLVADRFSLEWEFDQ